MCPTNHVCLILQPQTDLLRADASAVAGTGSPKPVSPVQLEGTGVGRGSSAVGGGGAAGDAKGRGVRRVDKAWQRLDDDAETPVSAPAAAPSVHSSATPSALAATPGGTKLRTRQPLLLQQAEADMSRYLVGDDSVTFQ